jgi:hypothetical protein
VSPDDPDYMASNRMRLEDFLSALVSVLNQNPSMGDENDIHSIEDYGLYCVRVISSGGVFLIRVGVDPI